MMYFNLCFQALRSLVTCWDIKDSYIVEAGLAQMCELTDWKVSGH